MYMSYTATCVHVLYRKKRILFVFGFDHVFIAAKLRFLFLFAKLSDVHVYMSYTAILGPPLIQFVVVVEINLAKGTPRKIWGFFN